MSVLSALHPRAVSVCLSTLILIAIGIYERMANMGALTAANSASQPRVCAAVYSPSCLCRVALCLT
jgi:hypothetical protein